MKKYIIASLLTLPLLAACVDDDYSAPVPTGNLQMDATVPASALMGDTIEFTVNCKDAAGITLSTLKAEMQYSGETVDEVTVRTKEEGAYTVKLAVPFLRFIPNGTAQIKLTLQNVTTKTAVSTVELPVTRPHFSNLQFVDGDGNVYDMVEDGNYEYKTRTQVNIVKNAFKGYFRTADKKFVFGSDGASVDLGYDNELKFTSIEVGGVDVVFNTLTYAYSPQEELPIPVFTADDNVYTGLFEQGEVYEFGGDDAVFSNDWYYDPDFFTKNNDGTYTFTALSGKYQIKAIFDEKSNPKGFRIHAVDSDNNPLKLSADGTGAIWIIGDDVYGKPSYYDAQGWWTDTDHDICLAPVADKIHQVTLTVGKQLKAGTKFNIKFFGQAGWGTEFKGSSGDYVLTTDNPYIGVGDGNGHDDGNLYLKDGVELKDGETYVFTIDLTEGCANGKLTVEKK